MVNKLLQRQLNRYLANGNELPAGLDELLASISAQYDAYDEDRRMLERIVDVSSAEMQQLHERLQADIERRKKNRARTADKPAALPIIYKQQPPRDLAN